MESLGNAITEYRKKLNLTQKDLGEQLNVSPQAVSKWENGQAEPDASTIKKLCEIFKISTDELLGNNPPASEIAATAATAAPVAPVAAPAPAPAPAPKTIVKTKIINGYCETCKNPVGPNEYVVRSDRITGQHIYCKKCYAIAEKRRKQTEYYEFQSDNTKSIVWGSIAGAVAILAALLGLIIGLPTFPLAASIPLSILAGLLIASFVAQMFWDGAVFNVFCFFLRSFRLPGIIFTLDLEGILFLIFVKVAGAILCGLLSAALMVIGVAVTSVISIFILPFAIPARISAGRELKRSAGLK